MNEDDCTFVQYNPFVYKGYYYDKETNLYYLNSRFYSPELCRFITIDDYSYLDPESLGNIKLYCYCNNNPVMMYDPSGTIALLTLLIKATVGAVVSLVGQVVSDVIEGLVEGNWEIAWEDYVGAAIGGAVGGIASLFVGVIGDGIGESVSSFISLSLRNISGRNNYSKKIYFYAL